MMVWLWSGLLLIFLLAGPVIILRALFPWIQLNPSMGFLGIYIISIFIIALEFIRKKPEMNKTNSLITLGFFSLFYILTYLVMIITGFVLEVPIYFIICILFLIATILIDAHSTNFNKSVLMTINFKISRNIETNT